MPCRVRSAVSIRRAAETTSLSAIGSSMRPSEDSALSLRAIMPSTASVSPARQNRRKTIQRPGSSGRKNAATKSGTSAMREMVRLLGSDDMAAFYRRDGAEVRQSRPFPTLIRVKKVINLTGQRGTHAFDALKVAETCLGYPPSRAKMAEQGLFARRAHAGDLLQRACPDGLGAAFAVAANGKTVGLVAQALQVIEHRTLGIEAERSLTLAVEMLASGLPLDAFRHPHDHGIIDTDIGQGGVGRFQLCRPPVDQDEVRPFAPFVARRFFLRGTAHQPCEAAGQHFTHHGDIVAGCQIDGF